MCGFEVVKSFFDQGVRQFRDHIGGEFWADGFHEEIALCVVEILVEFRKVGVVNILGGCEESGSILGIDGEFDRIDRVHVIVVWHERSVVEGNWEVNAEIRKNVMLQ